MMKNWLNLVGVVLVLKGIISFFDLIVEMPVWHGIIVIIAGAISLYVANTQPVEKTTST